MKIPPARLDSFAAAPPADLRVALLFGPDHGAVKLRADRLSRNVVPQPDDPFRVTLLTSEAISTDPALLYDAMSAMALGGGRCLVRVSHAEDKIAAAVSKLLQDMPRTDHFLLLESGELDKKSKLRALAEGDDNRIAALACYPEEGADRTKLIATQLRELGHTIQPDALDLLASLTPPDRLALFSELEKVSLYAGPGKTIELEDVLAALGDAAAVDLDSMVMAVASGDRAALDTALRRLAAENTAPVAMLRAAQRHFMRLLETRVRLDDGMSLKDALFKLQPRVFWKAETQFGKQAQKWPQTHLLKALTMLTQAEAQCKKTGIPDQTLCQQILLTLAR